MLHYLAFYKVDNQKGYNRHSFDTMESDEILECLNSLDNDEVRIYELEFGYNTIGLSMSDFVEDYNDEYLDGGWWSILI